MVRIFATVLFLSITIGLHADWNGSSKKKDGDNPGLITTLSFGDPAPMDRYFCIVSSLALDSTSRTIKTDSILSNLILSNAFPNSISDPVFRFDKDPYEQYYKILLGKTHDNCIDVAYDILTHRQDVVISGIGYGKGQNFYLKHVCNGRYKIFHSTGKVLALNLAGNSNESTVSLVDDNNCAEVLWIFVDPSSYEVYQPF